MLVIHYNGYMYIYKSSQLAPKALTSDHDGACFCCALIDYVPGHSL